MKLLEIQAIRALPEEYVKEGVRVTVHGNCMFAALHSLPTLMFDFKVKQWMALEITQFDWAFNEQVRIQREADLLANK